MNSQEDPSYYYHKAQHLGKRIPEVEENILLDPNWAYKYAHDIIKDRWPEAEFVISKDSSISYLYAKNIIKNRFYKAESLIEKDVEFAYSYAKEIIKGRWTEAESAISKDFYFSYKYAKNVLKNRFILGEETSLDQNKEILFYYAQNITKGKLPENLHNKMLTNALEFPNDEFVIKYFKLIKEKA